MRCSSTDYSFPNSLREATPPNATLKEAISQRSMHLELLSAKPLSLDGLAVPQLHPDTQTIDASPNLA